MVKCNHCGKEMVNTSTKYHLKTQHREIFETVQAEFEENVLKKQVINHGAKIEKSLILIDRNVSMQQIFKEGLTGIYLMNI